MSEDTNPANKPTPPQPAIADDVKLPPVKTGTKSDEAWPDDAAPKIDLPKTWRKRLIGLGFMALILIGGMWLVYNQDPPPGVDGEFTVNATIGGPFTLIDQHGKQVSADDFRDTHMLVFFGYTYCPDVCPTTLTTMATALDLLGEAAAEITPVFISIDPDRDTPEGLGEYAAFFHPRLVALSGSAEQVAAAARAYRVYYAKAPPEGDNDDDDDDDDYLMDHSAVVYLMGPDGMFITHFGHGTSPEDMAKGLRNALP